jgi:arabinofuranosyltransferase
VPPDALASQIVSTRTPGSRPDGTRSCADPLRVGVLFRSSIALVAAVALYFGWRTFWFMTDDAFIAFRYASNAMLGRGLVWNPAPFVPVEGYTSFSWTVLLLGVWKLTGIDPPASANWISLVCGAATLALIARLVMRMRWPRSMATARTGALALVLFGTLTNRTFLTWLSSGLETALFALLVTAWLASVLAVPTAKGPIWWPMLAASLLTLTRPDGLLFLAATAPAVALFDPRTRRKRLRGACVAFWPVGLVVAHLAFRLATYGEWLPNTFFAKRGTPWPESGLRYGAAFALEYGVWVWFFVVAVAGARVAGMVLRGGGLRAFLRRDGCAVLAIGALLAHVAYYTLIVGGDHFEFRIYNHIIPLLFVSGAALLAWLCTRAAAVYAVLGFWVVISWPIPWMHWLKTKDLHTRQETLLMIVPIAPDVPAAVRPVARWWDGLEAWLIRHSVGRRHQEHKVFLEDREAVLPSRSFGAGISWEEHPVVSSQTVGYLGWVFPNIAVIDLLGLNDHAIANNPVRPKRTRLMAHDRVPPEGYVACFRPNVGKEGQIITVEKRSLSDDDIRACERRWWR